MWKIRSEMEDPTKLGLVLGLKLCAGAPLSAKIQEGLADGKEGV
jgi:hypothetical protein